jgi:hypothetical protein
MNANHSSIFHGALAGAGSLWPFLMDGALVGVKRCKVRLKFLAKRAHYKA